MHTLGIVSYLLVGLFWMLDLPRRINSQDPKCISYPDLPRNCINICQCPSLLDVLIKFENSAGDYLRSTVCGCDDEDPLVCCPEQLPSNIILFNQSFTVPHRSQAMTNPEPFWRPKFPEDCSHERTKRSSTFGILPSFLTNRSRSRTPESLHSRKDVILKSLRWRWMAMLGYKTQPSIIQWNCGGSLISSRHVLTAAHCIDGQPNLYLVRLGEYDLNIDIEDGVRHVDVLIERAILHPLYNRTAFTNDVAVLKLERDVDISGHIRPICLPIHDGIRTVNLIGRFAFSAGWGELDRSGALPMHLQEIFIPVLPLEQCRTAFSQLSNYYADAFDDRKICAGEPGGQIPCAGDSGGPLVLQWNGVYNLVGFVAHGTNKCALPGYPELFIRVTEYLDFILSQLN